MEEAETCAEAEIKFRAMFTMPSRLITPCQMATPWTCSRRLKAIDAGVPIILLTAHASIELAVRAIQLGAEQFLVKPWIFRPPDGAGAGSENQRNRRKQLARDSLTVPSGQWILYRESSAIQRLEEQSRLAAATESPILIQGETGTGKVNWPDGCTGTALRSSEPILELNCGGFTKEFLETELFGHEKGAFTGRSMTKSAYWRQPIEERLPGRDRRHGSAAPAEILKALEEKRFRRLGEVQDRKVDFRLVAATHQQLDRLVQEQRFRSDLFYRISAIQIPSSPARSR